MLTFAQKVAIMESFNELQRRDVSLGRVNFHYPESRYDKKNVGYHFHPNGNGFVYAGMLDGCETDDKGFVNVRDYTEEALRELVQASIRSLSAEPPAAVIAAPAAAARKPRGEQRWDGPDGQALLLKREDSLWYVYAGLNLEAAFETYEEAVQYLQEEGFAPATV